MNKDFVLVEIDLEDPEFPTVYGIPDDEDPEMYAEKVRHNYDTQGMRYITLMSIGSVSDNESLEIVSEEVVKQEAKEYEEQFQAIQNPNIESSGYYAYEDNADAELDQIAEAFANFGDKDDALLQDLKDGKITDKEYHDKSMKMITETLFGGLMNLDSDEE